LRKTLRNDLGLSEMSMNSFDEILMGTSSERDFTKRNCKYAGWAPKIRLASILGNELGL